MAKISIIVPVYNVEKYLARCLDSCLNQTFSDIEVICVNDGSTDESTKILTSYEKYDNRIKVINKVHEGPSSAKNAGFEVAIGKYILFVDSDDYLSSIAVEKLYTNAEYNNSDFVIFDYISGTNNYENCQRFKIDIFGRHFENNPFCIENISPDMYKYMHISACSKLYLRKFLTENEIEFPEGIIFEDNSYFAQVYTKAKRITYVPEPLYYYQQGKSKQMSRTDEKLFDIIKVYRLIEDEFERTGHWSNYKQTIQLLMMMDFLKNLNQIVPELKEKFFNAYKELNLAIDYQKYNENSYLPFERTGVKLFEILMESKDYNEFMQNAKGVRVE